MVAAKAQAVMEGWPSMGVPLKVDISAAHSWGSMVPYDPITNIFPEKH